MICECCNKKPACQSHHKFSQTKVARKLYGKLIDHPRNIQHCCADCHASHASEKLIHWNEIEFCNALGIEPRSKQETRFKKTREGK